MRVSSDIGGTFTDLVCLNEDTGEIRTVKSSTVPDRFEQGVMDTIGKAGVDTGKAAFFIHGSTVVINTLTERKGAKTGLLTTKGFRDVLEITRANRPDLYNLYYTKPKPFVPRRYRLEITERIGSRGEVLEPIREEDVGEAVSFFLAEGIEAIAVCFLHSYAHPLHEKRCGEIIKALAPDMPVTLSSEITKEWREYERTNTSVLNSYVKKKTSLYLDNLESGLKGIGIKGNFQIMQSNGGSASFSRGREAPINMVESGPAGGVIGTALIGKVIGEENTIAFDVGGTTAKTSLLTGGRPKITTAYKIEWTSTSAGYPILTPTVDIIEIGAGGGSIAWIDPGGVLKIGPESAGAEPGPACYGRSGMKPTVTDANVVAGRINPGYFLGGEIPLNIEAAKKAMEPIAGFFQISVEEAAMGIIRLADGNMVNALKLISVRRGYDPRNFVMVAFGGGGAMHAGAIARELRLKEVVIPLHPGVFSAWGMLASDVRQDFIRTKILKPREVSPAEIETIYRELEEDALKIMAGQQIEKADIRFLRFTDVRYAGQEHTIKTPVSEGTLTDEAIQTLEEDFHNLHNQSFSFRIDAPIELVNYHLTCIASARKPALKNISGYTGSPEKAGKGTRLVNYDELGFHSSPVYERDYFPIDTAVQGPMIIEEPSSTTVVFPDQTVRRDEYGFLHIKTKQ